MKALKRLFGMRRYYLVMYNFSVNNGKNWGNGQMKVINRSGGYPSNKWLDEMMKVGIGETGDNIKCVVTSIIELSRRDYDDYVGGDEKSLRELFPDKEEKEVSQEDATNEIEDRWKNGEENKDKKDGQD